ncbi:hypothetical protein [Paenibacillus alba]|uniref:Uncharacterized protein n=1 Tax=Paenibacillus alba TaxID=1197127 RepID=A0ABU6GE87_9BACL|nr:hypothetical protein [Paenibacillus alba]MEC0230994.1 hypothetical protein [Paenibacillus alba]
MNQNVELCAIGLLTIGMMLLLCIDIIKKNKLLTFPLHQEAARTEEREEREAREVTLAVYPQYIDCSRNIHLTLIPADYWYMEEQLVEAH